MSACDGIGYASGSVILLSNLMSTTMRPLRVPFAFVVHIIKHGYVNGVGLVQSMRPWKWSQSNSMSTILQSFGPNKYILALPALNFSFQLTISGMSIH